MIEFGGGRDVAGVRLEEAIRFGQRVEAFAVDVRAWGAWYEVARGTTIGAQRILPTGLRHGDAVRLRILASQAPAILARFLVYAG